MNAQAEVGDEPAGRRQKIAVATVFVAAMFINIVDSTVVNVALPTIADQFDVPVEDTASINIGYLVAVAVTIPVSGWLGDRLGAREIFVAAVALFAAASAACGVAGSLDQLVIFRVVQGAAGGLMMPVGMAMLYRTFHPAERIRLGRITTVPIAFAPALGPVLGGVLTEHASWRLIFWINVPVGVVAALFTALVVRPLTRTTGNRLDMSGFVLAGLGFAGLMYAVSEGPAHGWLSAHILVPGLVGLALLSVLIPVELRSDRPMLQLRLFQLRLFRSANLISITASAGFTGALFVYPLMLQNALGHSPVTAGLLTFPQAIGVIVGTQVASRLYARVGPRGLITAGQAAVTAILCSIAVFMEPTTPVTISVVVILCLGFADAHTFLSNQTAAFDTVPRLRTGEASSLYNTARQVGGALGVALAASTMAVASQGAALGMTAAAPFRVALLACAACTLLAGLISWFTVHDEDAGPSRGLQPNPA